MLMPCWRMHLAQLSAARCSSWLLPALVVAVTLSPMLATPPVLPPPSQAATASSRPSTSPILMRVIAVLLAGRSLVSHHRQYSRREVSRALPNPRLSHLAGCWRATRDKCSDPTA
jgi:hypothetical protein